MTTADRLPVCDRVPLCYLCEVNQQCDADLKTTHRFALLFGEFAMAKEKFERTKPHVNVGTIGHVDHGKT
ncbi:MAG: hypothetical protein RSB07_13050, partial [Comamonas sp.]